MIVCPDTNFFLQCKDMKDINWNELCPDPKEVIYLVIVTPVIDELDKFKNQDNARRKRKGKAILAILDGMVNEDMKEIVAKDNRKIVLSVFVAENNPGYNNTQNSIREY